MVVASILPERAHLVAITAVGAVILGLVHAGRSLSGAGRRAFERTIAAVVLVLYLGYVSWDLLLGRFSVAYSLPLQLCDFVALVAGAAFVVHRRWLHALAYFWGLALSTQALITPDVAGAPGSLEYVLFWLYHAFVVGAGIYVVVVHRFRPNVGDLRVAVSAGVAWAAVTFLLDWVTGWNYGYLGRALPGTPTLLDYLGPWPLRAANMVALGALAMTVLWLPWALGRQAWR